MTKYSWVLLLYLVPIACYSQASNSGAYFIHHSIADALPGTQEWGTGAFTLADYDGDGDMDITISPRTDSGRVYWYENSGGQWLKHFLGNGDMEQLGAVAVDVDRDGNTDLVMGRLWFKNPGNLQHTPGTVWIRYVYNDGLPFENHDIAVADINHDGIMDIIAYSQKYSDGILVWYDAKDPMHWIKHEISTAVNSYVAGIQGNNGVHGGFAPKGVGDLDGDAYPDIVTPAGWFKNPGSNHIENWAFHQWPFATGIVPNPYGISWRSWVTDLDADGDNDIVYTDCDVQYSKAHWIENKGNLVFEDHGLPSPGDPTGSFHSLAVADFDKDGDLDIVSGEQEDADPLMKPTGLKERGILWLNNGTKNKPSFEVVVFHIDNPGWHEIQAGDVDGDGDIDLVSKVWHKDEGSAYMHVDYWENVMLRRKPQGK